MSRAYKVGDSVEILDVRNKRWVPDEITQVCQDGRVITNSLPRGLSQEEQTFLLQTRNSSLRLQAGATEVDIQAGEDKNSAGSEQESISGERTKSKVTFGTAEATREDSMDILGPLPVAAKPRISAISSSPGSYVSDCQISPKDFGVGIARCAGPDCQRAWRFPIVNRGCGLCKQKFCFGCLMNHDCTELSKDLGTSAVSTPVASYAKGIAGFFSEKKLSFGERTSLPFFEEKKASFSNQLASADFHFLERQLNRAKKISGATSTNRQFARMATASLLSTKKLEQPLIQSVDSPAFAFFQNRSQLQWYFFAMYFPEPVSIPVFYYLGKWQYYKTATACQACFVLFSGAFQFLVYRDAKKSGSVVPDRKGIADTGNSEDLDANVQLTGKVENFIGIPVKCLRIPRLWYEFITALPNYIQVLQTAVIAGTAEAITWTPQLREEFQSRWQFVPVVGETIGELGLPGLLRTAVALSCVCHFIFATFYFIVADWDDIMAEQADSANMLFLGVLYGGWHRNEHGTTGITRTIMICVSKVPLTWLKTSMFTLIYDCVDQWQFFETLLGVGLAWYSFLPLMPKIVQLLIKLSKDVTRLVLKGKKDICFKLCVACMLIALFWFLFVLFMHLVGAFYCPSHDWSIFQGCTTQRTQCM